MCASGGSDGGVGLPKSTEAQVMVPQAPDAGYGAAGFGLTFPLLPFLLFGVAVDTPHHCSLDNYGGALSLGL